MGQALFPIYQAAIDHGGVPLHAALLERDGKGILIAARGGKGKSTCCRLAPRHWNARCDDETLVLRSGSGALQCPSVSNVERLPLAAIRADLGRAKTDPVVGGFLFGPRRKRPGYPAWEKPKLRPESTNQPARSAQRMWRGLESSVQRENNLKLFANACSLAKDVPAFTLRASLTGRFWESIEKVLQDATSRQ